MNSTTKAGLLGLGLIVSLPSAAVHPIVEKLTTQQGVLQAQFETTDAAGCIVTNVSLQAAEFVVSTKPHGSSSSTSAAFYFISRFDSCNSLLLIFMNCRSDAFSVTMSRDLQNAHLTDPAVFCFDDVRNIGVYIDVDVTFLATEPAERKHIKNSITTPVSHFMQHVRGRIAEGVASGAIVENSTNYTSAPSFLALASDDAITEGRFERVH